MATREARRLAEPAPGEVRLAALPSSGRV